MEKITLLAKTLKNKARQIPHLTNLTLKTGEIFGWNHSACAITYNPSDPQVDAYLLHEFGHALRNHAAYAHDVDLITMEREAWEEARGIASEYNVTITDNVVEDALDGYRDWLHSRSLCPSCGATGIQTASRQYRCLACSTNWSVNEARTCALRRYPT